MDQDANARAGANADCGTHIQLAIDNAPADARGFLRGSVTDAGRNAGIVIAFGFIGRDSEDAGEEGGDGYA